MGTTIGEILTAKPSEDFFEVPWFWLVQEKNINPESKV